MQRGVEFVYTANWIALALSNALMVGMTHAEWRGRSQRGKGRTESFSTTIRDHSTPTQTNAVLPSILQASRAQFLSMFLEADLLACLLHPGRR
jgi:hypothetical protein